MRPIQALRMRPPVVAGGTPYAIINPGAELASMTGWTQDSGGPALATNTTGGGYPGPFAGSYYFEGAASAAASTFSQIVDLDPANNTTIDAGLMAIELSVQHGGTFNTIDYFTLILECLDSGGSSLGSFSAQNFSVPVNSIYYQRSAKIAVPANTRKIRVGAACTRGEGTVLDVYLDDFTYTLTTSLTSWSNSLSTGNRSASITVSATNISAGGGSPSNLVDGSQSNSYWWNNGTGNGTGYLTFDFGSPHVVDAFRWYSDVQNPQGVWRPEGSSNGSTGTQLGSDFTLSGFPAATSPLQNAGGIFYFPNTTAYRYLILRNMSGNRTTTPWLREIDFRIV
jgi:hypothetical protein